MSEEQAILSYLATNELIEDSYPWATANELDHKKVVGAIKSLSVDDYVRGEDLSLSYYTLTEQGAAVVESGSPEYVVFLAILQSGKLNLGELSEKVGGEVAKLGMANCMKNKWIKKDGADLLAMVESADDIVQGQLKDLVQKEGNLNAIDDKVCKPVGSCTISILSGLDGMTP